MNKAGQWLADPQRVYADGLRLYAEVFGTDKQYDFFAGASNPEIGTLHFNLLEEKMRRAARMLPAEQETSVPEVKTPVRAKSAKPSFSNPDQIHIVDNPLVEVTQLPEKLQKLFFDNKRMTIELAAAHAELKTATSDDARKELLARAKSLEKTRASNWKVIDQWWSENKGTGTDAKLDENAKRRETLLKNIRRAETEISSGKLDEAKIKSRKTKLATWKQELSDLKK